MDKIWTKFCQFDLYEGHTFLVQKGYFMHYLSVLSLFSKFEEDLKFWILDHFWDLFFQFDLYADQLIREYIR